MQRFIRVYAFGLVAEMEVINLIDIPREIEVESPDETQIVKVKLQRVVVEYNRVVFEMEE